MAARGAPLIGSGSMRQAAVCFACGVGALTLVALVLQWLFNLVLP